MNKKEGKSMRMVKKVSGVLLALCLLVPCFSMVASAADGKISFSDPETKVGEIVEVKCAVRSTGAALGDVEVQLSYDSEALSFESGDGAEANEDGSVTCTGSGGSSDIYAEFSGAERGKHSDYCGGCDDSIRRGKRTYVRPGEFHNKNR